MPLLKAKPKGKHRVQIYDANSGKSVENDGQIVKDDQPKNAAEPQPNQNITMDDQPRYDQLLDISKDDWVLWRPIFMDAKEQAKITMVITKKNIERILCNDGQLDHYNQRHCELPSHKRVTVTYTTNFTTRRLLILACRIRTDRGERVATTTSVAHNKRTDRNPWLHLVFPQCRVKERYPALCSDVPVGPIPFYDYPLRVAQKILEIKNLQDQLDHTKEQAAEKDKLLEKRDRRLDIFKARLDEVEEAEEAVEQARTLQAEVKELQEKNLVLETQKRMFKRQKDALASAKRPENEGAVNEEVARLQKELSETRQNEQALQSRVDTLTRSNGLSKKRSSAEVEEDDAGDKVTKKRRVSV